MDPLLFLLIASPATWRLSSLIADEHGPFMFLERIRFIAGVHYDDGNGNLIKSFSDYKKVPSKESLYRIESTELSKLLTCVWCVSPWIAALELLAYLRFGQPVLWILLPFSVSAVAILINRITNG